MDRVDSAALVRIKILLSAISWKIRETFLGKKWGRSEKNK